MDYNYNNNNQYNGYNRYGYGVPAITQGSYAARTFGWMFLGLALTFTIMITMVISGRYIWLLNTGAYFLLAIAEVVLVMVLSARIHKLSVSNARLMFFLYAILNGMTMCGILIAYSVSSLIYAFGMTALYFGVMALYGWFTKSDLTRIRPVLLIGLAVMVVWSILAAFLGLGANSRLMCVIGAGLFIAFTAYDTQKIRANYNYYCNDAEMLEKSSVICALQLYLDFINLFLYLLRLFGKRKN